LNLVEPSDVPTRVGQARKKPEPTGFLSRADGARAAVNSDEPFEPFTRIGIRDAAKIWPSCLGRDYDGLPSQDGAGCRLDLCFPLIEQNAD
jgi:hypothetical protein